MAIDFLKYLFLIFLFSLNESPLLDAQVLIYSDSTVTSFGNPTSSHGTISVSNCVANQIDWILQKSYDITKRSNGETFFYADDIDGISSFCLYAPWNGFSACDWSILTVDDSVQGLTCDETGAIFAAGKGITKIKGPYFDLSDSFLGNLPANLYCQGDITYREGKFYMVAVGNKLVEVNIKHPELSQVIMQFPAWVLPIHGLTTIQVNCEAHEVLG